MHRFTVYALNYIKRLFQSPEGTTIVFAVDAPAQGYGARCAYVRHVCHRRQERAPADPQQQERVLGQLRRALDLLVGNVKAKASALQQQGRAVRGQFCGD